MAGAAPTFGISQITTAPASFQDDLRAYEAAGAEAIGIWEFKLREESLAAFDDSPLHAGAAVPTIPSILPIPMEGPADPAERVGAICRSLENLAQYTPSAIVCLTGGHGPRETVVDGLRTIAAEAERLDLRVGLEPYQRIDGADWSILHTISDAVALLAEAGDPESVGILFDVWHLWNDPGVYDDLEQHGDRIVGVHVADYREPTRSQSDRVLPGDGAADVPRLLGAVERAGWKGPYELEIFSDELWELPAEELARRGREAFDAAWGART